MKQYVIALALLLCNSCTPARVPVPPGTIPAEPRLSEQDYARGDQVRTSLVEQFGEWDNPSARLRVSRILDTIFKAHPSTGRWTLTLLNDAKIVNAAATLGNQIFVWRGMVEQVKDDAVLAAVLGHEIAHVRAGHVIPDSAETTNQMVAGIAGAVVGALAAESGATAIANSAGRLTQATVAGAIINPYSQRLELEADTVGLFLMADAGYDPRRALDFWEQSKGKESKLSQFFSTHPMSSQRIENLKRHLPEALIRYNNRR